MVFNSMSDLFQTGVPDSFIVNVARVMLKAERHTFQVLTKRSARLRELLQTKLSFVAGEPRIWWGVSVEDRKYGLPRISHLQAAPTGVRFLSIEPLLEDLGTLDLSGIAWVIVDGESGWGARPIKPAWVRRIRRQCRQARVPFFFKQWGGPRKDRTGRVLDGRTWDEMPSTSPGRATQAQLGAG
jgi:protein gp37